MDMVVRYKKYLGPQLVLAAGILITSSAAS
jgi:hypothetical protein